MIILIGGVSHAGKTLLSQHLLEKYKYPYLSLDHIKMGLLQGFKDCNFTVADTTTHIAKQIWGIVKGIIITAIENRQNLIIEGCYILPHLILSLDDQYLTHIISVYICFSKDYLLQNFTTQVLHHRCAIEQRKYPEERSVTDFISESLYVKKLCIKANTCFFEIQHNYEKEIQPVYEFIDKQLSNKQ